MNESFEVKLQELETIVRSIESGKLSLDDSFKEFQKGIRLSKELIKKLDDINKKIEIVLESNETTIETADFGT